MLELRSPYDIHMTKPTRRRAHSQSGRPREFDADLALRTAAKLFWNQGYQATSIDQLCEATGIQRGSLYAAFRDKHGLFLAALEQYCEHEVAQLNAALGNGRPNPALIRNVLLRYTRVTTVLSGQRGCFATNSALELIPDDDTVRECIESTFDRMARAIATVVLRGQQIGTLRTALKADVVGDYFLCVIQGLRVVGRVYDDSRLGRMVDAALTVLE